jgi:hypothetical protein
VFTLILLALLVLEIKATLKAISIPHNLSVTKRGNLAKPNNFEPLKSQKTLTIFNSLHRYKNANETTIHTG